jgi:hypothetical protein
MLSRQCGRFQSTSIVKKLVERFDPNREIFKSNVKQGEKEK